MIKVSIQTVILYIITFVLVIISLIKSRKKTLEALKKAWKSFEFILPQFLTIVTFLGIILAFISTEQISRYIGDNSGWAGVTIAAVIGAITLMPGYIAFPTAAMLLKDGAGYMQIGAFISSLMMVGVVTLPLEIRFFSKKTAIIRNSIAFSISFLVAFIMGVIL